MLGAALLLLAVALAGERSVRGRDTFTVTPVAVQGTPAGKLMQLWPYQHLVPGKTLNLLELRYHVESNTVEQGSSAACRGLLR